MESQLDNKGSSKGKQTPTSGQARLPALLPKVIPKGHSNRRHCPPERIACRAARAAIITQFYRGFFYTGVLFHPALP